MLRNKAVFLLNFLVPYLLSGTSSVGLYTGMADQIIRAKYADIPEQGLSADNVVQVGQLKFSSVLSMGTVSEQLRVLGQIYDAQAGVETAVFDAECAAKLELIAGVTHPLASIVAHIGDPYTHTGELMLGKLLLRPAYTCAGVQERQKIVRALTALDLETQVRLATALEILKETEPYVLSLWRDPSDSEKMVLDGFYPSLVPVVASGAYERLTQAMLVVGMGQEVIVPVLSASTLIKNVKKDYKLHGQEITTSQIMNDLRKSFASQPVYVQAGIIAYMGGLLGWLSYNGYQISKLNKAHWSYFNALRVRVLSLQKYMQAVEELRKIMAHVDPEFRWPTEISDRMEQLQYALAAGGYDRPLLPGLFAPAGRVLNTYRHAREIRAELVPIMQAVGTIDAYATVAQLVNRMQAERVRYSFVECVDQELPVVEIKEFWNPLVDSRIVVTNSVQLGDAYNNRVMVLTGPNTGGKTTVIKALLLSIIMGQAFGIAPCEHMRFTPFARLFSYMNVADDISMGESLFAAEVRRAKELIVTIKSRAGHVFAIVDELFSGTAPREGAAASCQFISNVAQEDNAILSVATHFGEMTALETPESKIKNYRVTVVRNPDGTIDRTFKLEPGINTVNIAFDLLAEQGIFA